jgi:two-component system, NarL family, nitrate/nitrite response regulator NarL
VRQAFSVPASIDTIRNRSFKKFGVAMIKILIIDSNILFREGLSNLLQQEQGIFVIQGTGSISEAVEIIKICQPDLALLDADLLDYEDPNGIRLLRDEREDLQVVVFSSNQSKEQFLDFVRNGARGYLSKNGSLSTLITSIRAVERGEVVIPRALVGVLLDEFYRLTPILKQDGVDLLTPRERSVLNELGNGYSNREIADKLNIAENTVKVHVHNILEKLNLHNRRQAARFARTQLTGFSTDKASLETIEPA